MKILLGCYACDPGHGSEPGMGWNFLSNIAKFHDVHAIVEEGEFKEKLTHFSETHPKEVENITFHFVPRVHHETLRKIWPPSYYWFYRKWHNKAYKLARELDEKEKFDIVHQVTISGFRAPGKLWKLGKPFIWGPLGGFTDAPWCLLSSLGFWGAIHFALRNIINFVHKRWAVNVRQTARNSHTIIASTPQAIQEIRDIWRRDAVLMAEVGVETRHTSYSPVAHEPGTPLRICWAGEHKPRKALDLLLRALPLCKKRVELHVLSKGPRTDAWKKLAHKLGVADMVTFHGFVPREQAFHIMGTSHVFCITSIREDTSTVVFEAFRYGLPIVVLDHCGFSTAIDESSGIKIPIQSKKQVIADYARHLDYLATHEDKRRELSSGALKRCSKFTWEEKMKMLNDIYYKASCGVS
ncbi:MAG: glycosyltransferase family 4 protein [Akkermansia sp.]|nr:glycosyltransferase family 4 protein [Akkermansia sp.]